METPRPRLPDTDIVVIVRNPSLRDSSTLLFILVYQRFRPALNVSYALDYQMSELDPFGYHLTNLLLHSANVVLLFLLLSSLVRVRFGDDAHGALRGRAVAAFSAALLAVHPMTTEAVGGIGAFDNC